MEKNKLVIFLFFILIGISIGFFYYFFKNGNISENNTNYEATKTSTGGNNTSEDKTEGTNHTETEKKENGNQNTASQSNTTPPPVETNIATFSTKIYTKESARQNNINITCNSLNETIVKNGETFSFCSTVGQATTAKGYQKADIFDKNGNKKKGLRWW